MIFKLDQRLQNDSFFVYKLPLTKGRLINDRQFICWVLIQEINNVTEILELNEAQQAALWKESAMLSRALKKGFHPDKLNVAAIGNIVAQLHIHHLCRFKVDIAWPAPVWGRQPMVGYDENKHGVLSEKIGKLLQEQQSL